MRLPWLPGILLVLLVGQLFLRGLSGAGVAALLLCIAWFGLTLIDAAVRWRLRRAARREATSRAEERWETQLSLVLFLEESREVSVDSLSGCVVDALQSDGDETLIVETEPDLESWAGGLPPEASRIEGIRKFLVRLTEGVFAVLVSPRPYIEDPKTFAKASIEDKRLRRVVEDHRGWLSVDLVSATPEEPEGRYLAYDIIGKLLASMSGPDCLAVYAPELRKCNEFDPSLIESLKSGNPLAIFREPTFDPVIEIEEDHPRMKAAVEEARSRWPEFAKAFRDRGEVGGRFIVKAEFSEGEQSEFMWIEVDRIDEDHVFGTLMNDPHELIGIHRGSEVDLPLDRLNDWLFPGEDGEAVGGFTLKVLADESERRRRKDRGNGEGGERP